MTPGNPRGFFSGEGGRAGTEPRSAHPRPPRPTRTIQLRIPAPTSIVADRASLLVPQVLVDSPTIQRCVISLRRLALTSIVVDLKEEKSPSKETLAAALKAADVEGKWAASAWGKKIARQQARKNLTDFDRYKVMVARTKRSALIKKALA